MNDKKQIELLVQYLMLNNDNGDLGLFHGKMGLAVALCEYSSYTGNPLFMDVVCDWIDDIIDQVHAALPVDMEMGLCGIGVGFDYLAAHDCIAGDINLILSDFDRVIMERDVRRINDVSFAKGIAGIAYYAVRRLSSETTDGYAVSLDSIYLLELKQRIEVLIADNKLANSSLEWTICDAYLRCVNAKESQCHPAIALPGLTTLFKGISSAIKTRRLGRYPKGLDGGIAGTLLQVMRERGKCE
jgi:hypothetical protein